MYPLVTFNCIKKLPPPLIRSYKVHLLEWLIKYMSRIKPGKVDEKSYYLVIKSVIRLQALLRAVKGIGLIQNLTYRT